MGRVYVMCWRVGQPRVAPGPDGSNPNHCLICFVTCRTVAQLIANVCFTSMWDICFGWFQGWRLREERASTHSQMASRAPVQHQSRNSLHTRHAQVKRQPRTVIRCCASIQRWSVKQSCHNNSVTQITVACGKRCVGLMMSLLTQHAQTYASSLCNGHVPVLRRDLCSSWVLCQLSLVCWSTPWGFPLAS